MKHSVRAYDPRDNWCKKCLFHILLRLLALAEAYEDATNIIPCCEMRDAHVVLDNDRRYVAACRDGIGVLCFPLAGEAKRASDDLSDGASRSTYLGPLTLTAENCFSLEVGV